MVTQHGDPPLGTPGTRDDAVFRRRIPPHLMSNKNSSSRSGSPYGRNNMTSSPISSHAPPNPIAYRPSLDRISNSTPSRDEEQDNLSELSDTMSFRYNQSIGRSSPVRPLMFSDGQDEEEQQLNWPLPAIDSAQGTNTMPRMRSAQKSLRISMSTSSLNGKRRSPLSDRQYGDMESSSRPSSRFPPRTTPDLWQYKDPLRSSQTSGKTSHSSFEQISGTERSSILTKSSTITDMSPDTPNGYFGDDGDMTVEDAIEMYFDDIIDLPKESTSTQAVTSVGELDVIAENTSLSAKHSSVASLAPRNENPEAEQPFPDKGERNSLFSWEEFAANDKRRPAEDQDVSTTEDRNLSISQSIDPPQINEEPAGPANIETSLPQITSSKKPSPQNLSIDVAVAKLDQKAVNQPIPSPRYSTVIRVAGQVPPAFLPGTDDRDFYGFRKATHHVSREQFEAWNKTYVTFAEHRRVKWVKLMESSGLPTESPVTFPPKSNVIKRYVRKGIPYQYRGAAWFYYAGGYKHMHPNPGHYANLVQEAMTSSMNTDKEHIERDLYRTFPDNVHFKPEMTAEVAGAEGAGGKSHSVVVETQMIRSLRRVLYAFALHNPRIGYTQSLNFITGMLLLFLPEEKAFWMLHIITTELLPATHEISLEGANVDMWILMVLLRDNLPNVYTKLVTTTPTVSRGKAPALTVNMRLPDITLGLTSWLMSMFIGSLPLETTLRVWDCFFYEGSKTFFRVAMGIFKAGEKEIMSVSDPMEVFQIVQTVPKKLLDPNALLEESLSRKYRMGQGRIDTLREQRREAVRQEKTRLSLFANKSLGLERPATRSGLRSPLPRLDGWRPMKKNTFN